MSTDISNTKHVEDPVVPIWVGQLRLFTIDVGDVPSEQQHDIFFVVGWSADGRILGIVSHDPDVSDIVASPNVIFCSADWFRNETQVIAFSPVEREK